MQTSTTRIWTPARIVALALIAILVMGLVYLRVGTGSDPVSVPGDAKAGDLLLEDCQYATEKGSYAADCGTLVVAENRADPESRLIALPVTRIRARSDHPGEPIFPLWGGPGLTNMKWPQASRFADAHDVVLVGYRGVDGSVRLDCPEVESALTHSSDFLSETSFRAFADAFRSCADRLTEGGVDLAGYDLPQRVDDLEDARMALGYDRIDLLSESAGTRTAMIYSWRYPESIHRSVMVAANPPGHFLWDPQTTDELIGRYADLCSNNESCSKRTDDLAASMRRTAANMPARWLFLPIQEGNVSVSSFYGLMESTMEAAPLAAPLTLDAWLSAAEGDASGFWFQSLLADLAFPESFVWGELAATAGSDAQAGRDYFSSGDRERDSNLGYNATAFGWGGGRLIDAWPSAEDESEYSRVRTSEVETLLIGGALDFASPPQGATEELLPYLPNGHQVVLPGFGHTTSFWTEQPEAGSRLINTFFDSGGVDDSLYEPQSVDLTPGITYTALGKGFAGTMVGLGLLAAFSLLWLPHRVHKRGRIGPKAGAWVRTVYPIVLGLGGWFVAALIVLTTMPTVSLGNQPMGVLAIGAPIGWGIYWAWVHRMWSASTKAAGFALAMGASLVGAWLGFNVTTGLLALFTTIVGAGVGANLILIIHDMSRDRSVRIPRRSLSPQYTAKGEVA